MDGGREGGKKGRGRRRVEWKRGVKEGGRERKRDECIYDNLNLYCTVVWVNKGKAGQVDFTIGTVLRQIVRASSRPLIRSRAEGYVLSA